MNMVIIKSAEANERNGGSLYINDQLIGANLGAAAKLLYRRIAELPHNVTVADSRPIDADQAAAFRRLRRWHWKQLLLYRECAKAEKAIAEMAMTARIAIAHMDKAAEYDKYADEHLSAVQILNDAPGCQDSTAEGDYNDYRKDPTGAAYPTC